jgi:hypothetical protein
MDSIFECGVCFKNYNCVDKKPLSLPCGHTFCLDCLRQINKHTTIKCPFDKSMHSVSAESLPVNYAVLTALPTISSTISQTNGSAGKDSQGIAFCEIHKNKKVKFYCKNDHEMFCSKCVLKHTNAKHDVTPCSHKGMPFSSPSSARNEAQHQGNARRSRPH